MKMFEEMEKKSEKMLEKENSMKKNDMRGENKVREKHFRYRMFYGEIEEIFV